MIPTFWDAYFSVPEVQADGVAVPLRSILNFIGCNVVDDETNKRTNITPGAGGGDVTGRSSVTIPNADYTLVEAEYSQPIITLAGSATVARALTFPFPATEADSYFRFLECNWSGGGAVQLRMSSGSTWTLPFDLSGSRAPVLAFFTPTGVTAFGMPSGAAGAVQLMGVTGYMSSSSLTYDTATGKLTVGASIEVASGGPTITKGTGAPGGPGPNGSIYLRTDGTSTTTLYVRAGGAWSAVGGGGGGVAGSDTQVQFNDGGAMAGDAGLTYAKATDVLSVAGGVAVGGANPASTGLFRTTNGGEWWARNVGNTANLRVAGLDSSNVANYGDEVAGYGGMTVTHSAGGSLKLKYWTGSTYKAHISLDGTNVLFASPRIGDSAPYASDGRTSISTDANVTLSAAQYSRHVINCTGALTVNRTYTFPHPASEDASYTKALLHNGSGQQVVVSTGTGTTVTVGPGQKTLLAFTPGGVQSIASFQIA